MTTTKALRRARKLSEELEDAVDWPASLRLGVELRQRIDEWRRYQKDLPARAEAARRLIEIGLEQDS